MPLCLGHADPDVKGVDDWLTEVFFHSGIPQATQVHTVEVLLVPEVDLVDLEKIWQNRDSSLSIYFDTT